LFKTYPLIRGLKSKKRRWVKRKIYPTPIALRIQNNKINILRCSTVSNTVAIVDASFKEDSNSSFKKNRRLTRRKIKPHLISLILRKKRLTKLPKNFFKKHNIVKKLCFFRRTNVRYNHQIVLDYFSNRRLVYQRSRLKRFSSILRRTTFTSLASLDGLVKGRKNVRSYLDYINKMKGNFEGNEKRFVKMRKKHR
jgi:hypothetical protein